MPPWFVQLVAFVLLTVQGVIGVIPGRVLCIPLAHCHSHGDGGAACAQSHGPRHCQGHEHGPLEIASHPFAECECHVHVPVPDEQPMPGASRGEVAESRPALVMVAMALPGNWAGEMLRMVGRLRPPDWGATGQVRALKATRLLI
jgi:hypothetical protein